MLINVVVYKNHTNLIYVSSDPEISKKYWFHIHINSYWQRSYCCRGLVLSHIDTGDVRRECDYHGCLGLRPSKVENDGYTSVVYGDNLGPAANSQPDHVICWLSPKPSNSISETKFLWGWGVKKNTKNCGSSQLPNNSWPNENIPRTSQ